MVIDELNKVLGTNLNRHQVEIEPIRTLGEHVAIIRLTVDLNPRIKVMVYREGETIKAAPKMETPAKAEEPVEVKEEAAPAAEEAEESAE
jgi:large subunit ribosomal protein L9